jgi:hypothetical protein
LVDTNKTVTRLWKSPWRKKKKKKAHFFFKLLAMNLN